MYKLSYNISFAEWKRKWLLLLIINFCITPIEMLANYKIESSNYILRIASKDKGRLLLQNKQSETLVQLGELKLGQWPQLELKNNCKYEITNKATFKMPMTGDDGKWKFGIIAFVFLAALASV